MSAMDANKTEPQSGDEILVRVPKDLALFSLGFAIDAGGSVTKLLYRSKEDYENGKRIGKFDDGVLRMRYFASAESEKLILFLRDHCDVMDTAVEGDGWYHTGVRTQSFMEQMETILNLRVKMKLLSEPDAICKSLLQFYPLVPDCRPFDLEPRAVGLALETCRSFMSMIEKSKEIGEGAFVDSMSKSDPERIKDYVNKLLNSSAEEFAKELSQQTIELPALCVTCGSADAMLLIQEDGKYDLGNFNGVCGKTFLGLGRLLCGAQDFDELIDMASRGDHNKVDTLSGDLKVDNRKEEDWYSAMPGGFVIFTMGKLAEEAYKGTYTKEDLAAGLMHLVISVIAKIASTTARLLKVT